MGVSSLLREKQAQGGSVVMGAPSLFWGSESPCHTYRLARLISAPLGAPASSVGLPLTTVTHRLSAGFGGEAVGAGQRGGPGPREDRDIFPLASFAWSV